MDIVLDMLDLLCLSTRVKEPEEFIQMPELLHNLQRLRIILSADNLIDVASRHATAGRPVSKFRRQVTGKPLSDSRGEFESVHPWYVHLGNEKVRPELLGDADGFCDTIQRSSIVTRHVQNADKQIGNPVVTIHHQNAHGTAIFS